MLMFSYRFDRVMNSYFNLSLDDKPCVTKNLASVPSRHKSVIGIMYVKLSLSSFDTRIVKLEFK